jgi:hypothetical protein
MMGRSAADLADHARYTQVEALERLLVLGEAIPAFQVDSQAMLFEAPLQLRYTKPALAKNPLEL